MDYEIELLILNHKYAKALELLDSELENDENDIDSLFLKAMIYSKKLDFDDALKEFDNILKIDPNNINALLFKGEMLAGLHEYDKAIETFNEIHPDILPYAYKKLIDYITEFNYADSSFYSVFVFDSYWEYVYVESNIFKRLKEKFLDDLESEVVKRGLIWTGLERDLQGNSPLNNESREEYQSLAEPADNNKNKISGIRLSDEESNYMDNRDKKEKCVICGRKLKKNQKNLCRACFRKQYASKIIKKLVFVIEPGLGFKKGDLKSLNLSNAQIDDYIWTLQEFNLIEVESNKFKLKDKDTLNKFRIDSKMDPIDFNIIDEENRLIKICKICGKTLPISQFYKSSDDYDGVCKICKKLIVTARYLEEIIRYVGFDNEFNQTDLIEYIPNKNQIMGMLWSLQDNDLLIEKEGQIYILADESKCLDFLDKYQTNLKEINIKSKVKSKPKSKTKAKPKTKPKSKAKSKSKSKTKTKGKSKAKDKRDLGKVDSLNEFSSKSSSVKKEQMDIVLEARENGKTREEAAEIANIPLHRINHWYKEGRQGVNKEDIAFYKQLKKIENRLLSSSDSNERKQMEFVLKLLSQGKSKSEVAKYTEINASTITFWYNDGKKGNHENSSYFYNQVNMIKDLVGGSNFDENSSVKNSNTKKTVDESIDKNVKSDIGEELYKSSKPNKNKNINRISETDDKNETGDILSRLRKLYEEDK